MVGTLAGRGISVNEDSKLDSEKFSWKFVALLGIVVMSVTLALVLFINWSNGRGQPATQTVSNTPEPPVVATLDPSQKSEPIPTPSATASGLLDSLLTPRPASESARWIASGFVDLFHDEHGYVEAWNCNEADDGEFAQKVCEGQGFQSLAQLTQIVFIGVRVEVTSKAVPAALAHYVVYAYDKAIPELGLLVFCRYSDFWSIDPTSTGDCETQLLPRDDAVELFSGMFAVWDLRKPK